MKKILLSGLAAAVLAVQGFAQSTLLAHWNFNNTANLKGATIDSTSVTSATMTNSGAETNFAGTLVNAVAPDVAGQAYAVQGAPGGTGTAVTQNGMQLVWSVNTSAGPGLGFFMSNIQISWATQRSGTGFNNNTLEYQANNSGTWVSMASGIVPPAAFAAYTSPGFTISPINKAYDIKFRLTLNGATAVGGNNRIDNVQIKADLNPVPEPASFLALGAGAAMLLARKKRA